MIWLVAISIFRLFSNNWGALPQIPLHSSRYCFEFFKYTIVSKILSTAIHLSFFINQHKSFCNLKLIIIKTITVLVSSVASSKSKEKSFMCLRIVLYNLLSYVHCYMIAHSSTNTQRKLVFA